MSGRQPSRGTFTHRCTPFPLAMPVLAEPPEERPRFLSEADCQDIAERLARFATGGGVTAVQIVSTWQGNIRWGRNLITTGGDVRTNNVNVMRDIHGARNATVLINQTSDPALVAAARRAERLVSIGQEQFYDDLEQREHPEPFPVPPLFYETTYQLDADRRAAVARHLTQSAAAAGMVSAGYIQVAAHSLAYITSWGYTRYFQYTWAQYSVTVRDRQGTGSGWAGVDWPDWSRIDGTQLSAIALEKCLQSRNPVAIEPGRYLTILEPQAVCDFTAGLMGNLGRWANEHSDNQPFNRTPDGLGYSQLGERVVDARISISADPMDPELGFPPFDPNVNWEGRPATDVYRAVTWVDHGVLVNLEYDRDYALRELGRSQGLANSGAFRMSGGETSLEEMIATSNRGLLVTRFDRVQGLDNKSLLQRGYTRDGLWLIEQGKISKPVKNLVFVESILFALNNVEQLGVPQRVFHPTEFYKPNVNYYVMPQPVIVPPLKVRDFSFTALCDAV